MNQKMSELKSLVADIFKTVILIGPKAENFLDELEKIVDKVKVVIGEIRDAI